ncbi:ABC transporter permease [Niveibacterium sp.]|uniref:ABC transporter permease n=1 Tax=Niveibacterium sp. TaxID=2017444 RepID=UPI0035B103F4
MHSFSISPTEMFSSFWKNKGLIKALAQREVVGRYRGSVMGILWSFVNPVFMLLVYTFVFSVVFKARWNTGSESRSEFALILFSGLMVFNVFSECVNGAPSLISSNANYVKKVVFPLEVLPWVSLASSLFHFLVSFVVWLVFYVVIIGWPGVTVLLLPLVLFPLVLFVMGVSWVLASLGVYLRDVSQFAQIATSVLMFLSPIFYPANALPPEFRNGLLYNPLSIVIEQTRDVLLWSRVPDVSQYVGHLIGAATICWLGFSWFQKTRKGFADVL